MRRADPIIIVGASVAGLNALEAIREVGWVGEVIVLEREQHGFYDRPPLSKNLFGERADRIRPLIDEEDLAGRLHADVQYGVEAIGLDVEQRSLFTTQGRMKFAQLILALGVEPVPLQIPGAEHLPCLAIRTAEQAERAAEHARATSGRVAIVGGGLIGNEVVSSAVQTGRPTTLVSRSAVPLASHIGEAASALVLEQHRSWGVDLRLGVTPVRATAHTLNLSDGSTVNCDLLVYGVGGRPATGWLEGSGIRRDESGVILCDELLQAAPNVFAAGDVASWPSAYAQSRVQNEHWTTAAEQGRVAGANAVNSAMVPFDTVPYMWCDLYGVRVQVVGSVGRSEDALPALAEQSFDRFLTVWAQGNSLLGACGIGVRRQMAQIRRLMKRRGTLEEALTVLNQ